MSASLLHSRRNGSLKAEPEEHLPPYDSQAEAGALACVVSSEEGEKLFDKLSLDDFYDIRHKEIYSALKCLRIDRKPLDVVALSQWLKAKGLEEEAGGSEYVMRLPDATPSPANWPTWLEALKDIGARRAIVRDSSELLRLAKDPKISRSALEDAARRMGEAYSTTRKGGLTIRRPDEILALQFDDSDRIVGDRLLATGQSLVIAGAGGVGKSRLLLQMAIATIVENKFIGFETRRPELRWLILQAENSNRRLRMDLEALRKWAGPRNWAEVNERLAIHTLETDADGFMCLDNPTTQQQLADVIGEQQPGVIVWDSLYNFAVGDLNRDADMAETLLMLSRLSRAGNHERAIIVIHHSLTGRAAAARATGFDRSSFGRNSKVLFAWARAQLNLAPGLPDSNDVQVVSCAKASNGKEFAPFAIRLDLDRMIYQPAPDFDLTTWQTEMAGKAQASTMSPERVRELCKDKTTKPALAKRISEDCGCSRATAYRHISRAEGKTIEWNKTNEEYSPKH